MKEHWYHNSFRVVLLATSLALCGCSSISVNTKAYLGSPKCVPSDPARLTILAAEPKQPNEKLGEIMLSVGETRAGKSWKTSSSRLPPNSAPTPVYVVYDKTHVFPVAYAGWWGGPYGVSEDIRRDIVAVAIK